MVLHTGFQIILGRPLEIVIYPFWQSLNSKRFRSTTLSSTCRTAKWSWRLNWVLFSFNSPTTTKGISVAPSGYGVSIRQTSQANSSSTVGCYNALGTSWIFYSLRVYPQRLVPWMIPGDTFCSTVLFWQLPLHYLNRQMPGSDKLVSNGIALQSPRSSDS